MRWLFKEIELQKSVKTNTCNLPKNNRNKPGTNNSLPANIINDPLKGMVNDTPNNLRHLRNHHANSSSSISKLDILGRQLELCNKNTKNKMINVRDPVFSNRLIIKDKPLTHKKISKQEMADWIKNEVPKWKLNKKLNKELHD